MGLKPYVVILNTINLFISEVADAWSYFFLPKNPIVFLKIALESSDPSHLLPYRKRVENPPAAAAYNQIEIADIDEKKTQSLSPSQSIVFSRGITRGMF